MDAQVDNHLGDSITYSINGVPVERAPGNPTVPAFLSFYGDDGGMTESINPQIQRWRLKINRKYLPAGGPSMRHLIESPKLGAIRYRPMAANAESDGEYWICDLQPAPGA
jgi:hypothetical protein